MSDPNSLLAFVQTSGGWGLLVLSLLALYRKDNEVKKLNTIIFAQAEKNKEKSDEDHKTNMSVLKEHVDTNATMNKHLGEANILMADVKEEMRRCSNDRR